MEDLEPALDILQSQAYIALIEFGKIVLRDPPSVMVETDEEFITAGILSEVDEAGAAMLQDIVHQFLDNPEDDEFGFCLEAFPVVVEAGAGVHAAGAADLLEEVIDGRFQPEIFQGGRHEAMGDIADQLDGIVDNLLGIVDALELGGFIQVDQVLIEVEAGGSQKGACIVVEVGCNTLAFFFLEPDGGVQEKFLLVIFHFLQAHLVADDLALVEDDKDNEPDGEGKHTDGPEKQDKGYTAAGGRNL